jgi:hypothetical protein
MASDPLDELRRIVVDDRRLIDRLSVISDRARFVAAVTEVASERGIELRDVGVREGLDAARRRRRERWV